MFNIKKKFFQKELKQTQARIWAHEFSRYTSLFEREKTRQLYDKANDAFQRLTAQKHKDAEQAGKQVDSLKISMDELDKMIEGAPPSTDYPEGIQGITQALEAQIQKREHIKNFIKHYC